jgi:hypothetical protein
VGKEHHRRSALTVVRLHALVEGQSEEAFIKHILAPHLGSHQISMDVRMVSTNAARGRTGRGGVTTYAKLRRDLSQWLRQDATARFTTCFDCYRLPSDFPGMKQPRPSDPEANVAQLEAALVEDVGSDRLIPYLQLHEFEALILSDPSKLLLMYPDRGQEISRLRAEVALFSYPEQINHDEPPSKRILKAIPEYSKVAAATQILEEIGLPRLRHRCPHFHQWVTRLEAAARA